MAFILYQFADGTRKEIEVTEEFAKKYAEMEHKDALIERKETRRHQSLDKSLEHGFDIPDPTVDITEMAERRELSDEIHKALNALTEKKEKYLSCMCRKDYRSEQSAKEWSRHLYGAGLFL